MRSCLLIALTLPAISLASSISPSTFGDIRPGAQVRKLRKQKLSSSDCGGSDGWVDDGKISGRQSSTKNETPNTLSHRGGDAEKTPSIYWAVFHNWMYFLSLGFNLINIQFLVREIIDGDAKASPSAKSIALSGKVESVDKLLTFLGIGFLSALSDKYGRKPLM